MRYLLPLVLLSIVAAPAVADDDWPRRPSRSERDPNAFIGPIQAPPNTIFIPTEDLPPLPPAPPWIIVDHPNPSEVPEPSTVAILLSGILALAAVRWWRRR